MSHRIERVRVRTRSYGICVLVRIRIGLRIRVRIRKPIRRDVERVAFEFFEKNARPIGRIKARVGLDGGAGAVAYTLYLRVRTTSYVLRTTYYVLRTTHYELCILVLTVYVSIPYTNLYYLGSGRVKSGRRVGW